MRDPNLLREAERRSGWLAGKEIGELLELNVMLRPLAFEERFIVAEGKVLAAALALGQRLAAFGVEPTEITNLGPISNMLFRDNNEILLEATWPEA